MKKTFILAILIGVTITSFVSCQKNRSESADIPANFTVEEAISYHRKLESRYGNYDLITVSGKTEQSVKQVDFSRAYVGENERCYFVEAPISYSVRQVVLNMESSIPTAELEKMLSNSFDRLVIYKDKMSGLVNERIVTVIPSVDYLNQGRKELVNYHYERVPKDFSGYVTYKDWKGKFLSTQSYNVASVKKSASTADKTTARVNDIDCNWGVTYYGTVWCEDVDEHGNGVNCDYQIHMYEGVICDIVAPSYHNHSSPVPDPGDGYWEGWPDPQNIPGGGVECPYGPRTFESPVIFAGIYDTTFSVSFFDACFCQGYSFIMLENTTTGAEYSFPIDHQNFFIGENCTTMWETHVPLPPNIPDGRYYVKVWLDGDIFYHQFEDNGTIIKRFRHSLTR